jgi:hypothetical protein
MPMSYEIDNLHKCIFVRLYGDITAWDLGTALLAMWEDPEFDPRFARLVEATDIHAIAALHDRAFLKAVAQDVRKKTRGKLAFVAAADPVYGTWAIYREELKGIDCQVFRDTKHALKWLGL